MEHLRRPPVLAALLFVLTLALYWRTGEFEFLNYDDDVYVTQNAGVRGGLSWEGVRWAFTTTQAANWHPLTWLSHQLDVELFGLDAGAHHRTSVVLHALNAALCLLALSALTGSAVRSALVAGFFALHPLRVESVAWISERKDLLAAGCFFGCLWLYAGHVRSGRPGRYVACLAVFALGLAAKPMLVTLPLVLLLLDAWPLRRLSLKPAPSSPVPSPSPAPTHPGKTPGAGLSYAVLLEKLPFLALTLASAVITFRVQRAGGAFGPGDAIGLEARLANALHAGGLYVWKSVVPTDLCAYHPHPALAEPPLGPWTPGAWAGAAWLAALSALAVLARRRAPAVPVGWLWFLGMLVPVIGLVQVGLAGWAERYAYLPSAGLGLALVWGAGELARSAPARAAALVTACLALAGLTLASRRQIETWRDSRTLFEHALRVDESAVAHVNLGRALEEANDLAAAARHYERALELRPSLGGVRVNLARVWQLQAAALPPAERALRLGAAESQLARALASDPSLGLAHAALGLVLSDLGRDEEALVHLRRAVELQPGDPSLRNNLAWVLATSRAHARPEEALAIATHLCQRSSNAGFQETLAAALARLGRFDEAADLQRRALERVPAQYRARVAERLELFRARQPLLKSP